MLIPIRRKIAWLLPLVVVGLGLSEARAQSPTNRRTRDASYLNFLLGAQEEAILANLTARATTIQQQLTRLSLLTPKTPRIDAQERRLEAAAQRTAFLLQNPPLPPLYRVLNNRLQAIQASLVLLDNRLNQLLSLVPRNPVQAQRIQRLEQQLAARRSILQLNEQFYAAAIAGRGPATPAR
ncbi:hypothetical protein [Singulisphaera sp. PoT]|uniref:hypothetical protein n=1 Tax=Singulisphaera sp. PoT TaxID=3411797 RepID=UPI003BF4F17E